MLASVVAAALLLTTTALAHPLQGGWWWGSNHVLPTQVSQGNVVGHWQAVLHYDGNLFECGVAGVDGLFGAITQQATWFWQAKEVQNGANMPVDGIAGPLTWGWAGKFLIFVTCNPPGPGSCANYVSRTGIVAQAFAHNPALDWSFQWFRGEGLYHLSNHPSITFPICS